MKCLKCGADIYDGVKKCPYCKTLTQEVKQNEKFKDFDFKYTITSDEQMEKIRKTVKAASKAKKAKKGIKVSFEQWLAERRAAKRARKRAVRRGEDPELAVKRLEKKEETNPFLKNTAVTDVEEEALNTYRRVKKAKTPERQGVSNMPKRVSVSKDKKKSANGKKINAGKLVKPFAALVALVLVIYLFVLLFGWLFGRGDVNSYSYAKDNSLNIVYETESLTISKTVIDENYMRKLGEMEEPPSVDSIIKSADIIHTSKDGKTTFFFENYDPETKCGRLRMIVDGDVEDAVTISEAVHNSLVMTADGKKLLYLRAYDAEVQTGALHFWEEGMEEPLKISTDIDPGTYEFSKNGEWAFFIQNLNRTEQSGDLYVKNLVELDDEKKKLDSDICMLFGTSAKGKHHIYGKEYDTADGTFDVYAIDADGQMKRLGERTAKNPLLQKTVETVLILGVDEDGKDNTHNLYSVEIGSGKKTKIDSEVNSILMLSKDEDTIIYEKMYDDKVSDFYAYTEGELPSKVAGNVIVDYEVVGENPQVAITDDCENILYISEFDSLKAGGTLVWCEYKGDEVVSEQKIAEDVRSCYSTDAGLFVFTKNYSVAKNYCDVYVFSNGQETVLREEVYPNMFGVDRKGNNIYYISNYNVQGSHGILERMNLNGESVEISGNVFDFKVAKNGDVMFKKNFNTNKKTFDLFIVEAEKHDVIDVNTSVGEILQP